MCAEGMNVVAGLMIFSLQVGGLLDLYIHLLVRLVH